jgi:hypothetical protein
MKESERKPEHKLVVPREMSPMRRISGVRIQEKLRNGSGISMTVCENWRSGSCELSMYCVIKPSDFIAEFCSSDHYW